jgi:hypothetical protein
MEKRFTQLGLSSARGRGTHNPDNHALHMYRRQALLVFAVLRVRDFPYTILK